MPNKLRSSTPRVSFFAFQDMITTVTGVLIIVMLLLSIEVSHRASAAAVSSSNPVRKQLAQARAELAATAQTLRQREAELRARTNSVFVIPEPDRSGKSPVLVVLSATNGSYSRMGEANLHQFTARADRTDFPKALQNFDPSRDRLVFYVRPSGIGHFERCLEIAKAGGFSVGYDAAEEDKQYVLLTR